MYLLIDTAFNSYCAVGVAERGKVRHSCYTKALFRQSETLISLIHEAIGTHAISGIIVTQGFGDFSALRIGISTANALAYAWKIPVVGYRLPAKLTPEERLVALAKKSLLAKGTKKTGKSVLPVYGKKPNIRHDKKKK